jgi:hypothetical protein
MRKNPILAFLLAFFPGGGMFYLGKVLRGLFYMAATFGLPLLSIALISASGFNGFIIIAVIGLLIYLINFVDTAITASKLYTGNGNPVNEEATKLETSKETERFYTIILSFLPGLGHFQLGLMSRGVTLLTAFLGLVMMVIFVSALTGRGEFLAFLAILPVIWAYSFFDVIHQLKKKQSGEELVDRSILEDFEMRREDGKKSKTIATLLSIFPGAGHLYLGLQRRGIQLMAAFLFSIYILDVLRLGIFLFLIPIIWFYSLFDSLQISSKYGKEEIEDTPIVSYFINHQKWLGAGLVLLGFYYLFTNLVMPSLAPMISEYLNIDFRYLFDQYLQTVIVCLLLIGGGIKLLMGKKTQSKEETK